MIDQTLVVLEMSQKYPLNWKEFPEEHSEVNFLLFHPLFFLVSVKALHQSLQEKMVVASWVYFVGILELVVDLSQVQIEVEQTSVENRLGQKTADLRM